MENIAKTKEEMDSDHDLLHLPRNDEDSDEDLLQLSKTDKDADEDLLHLSKSHEDADEYLLHLSTSHADEDLLHLSTSHEDADEDLLHLSTSHEDGDEDLLHLSTSHADEDLLHLSTSHEDADEDLLHLSTSGTDADAELVYEGKLSLTQEDFKQVFEKETRKFRTDVYPHFFGSMLNSTFTNIPCVIKSNGAKVTSTKYRIKLGCMHKECGRQYTLLCVHEGEPMENNIIFYVTYSGILKHSARGVARELRGLQRSIARTRLANCSVAEYIDSCVKSLDVNLRAKGNLQNLASVGTLSKVRSEALASQDYDKDDIIDLSKMREQQKLDVINKVEGAAVTIDNVNKNPFHVFAISDDQVDILLKLEADGHIVVIHVDATGGVARAPEGVDKRIYYYTAILPLPLPRETTTCIFPLMEMISSSHNARTIGTWMRHLKWKIQEKTNKSHIVHHVVSDFSYAILNALCDVFNGVSLTDYINCTFNKIFHKMDLGKTMTEVHICCNHFMKNTAKDVNDYFPESKVPHMVRAVLKEAIGMMFNMRDLEVLSTVYRNINVLLTSKYVNENVTSALQTLMDSIATDKDNNKQAELEVVVEEEEEQTDEVEEVLIYDETMTYHTLFETSLFYQHFKKMNHDGVFKRSENVNNLYSPQFAELFLKKYMTILPLWTSINNGSVISNSKPESKRFTNSYVEKFFQSLKHRILDEVVVGQLPTKSSRVFKATRKYIIAMEEQYLLQIPRTKCCGNKRGGNSTKPRKALKRLKTNSSTPRLSTPRTPKQSRTPRTPTQRGTPRTPSQRGTPRTPTQHGTPRTPIQRGTPRTPTLHETPETRTLLDTLGTTCTPTVQLTPTTSLRDNDKISNSISKHCKLRRRSSTPNHTSHNPLDNPLDNPFAEEIWKPKQPKHSYFSGNALRNLISPRNLQKMFKEKENNEKPLKMKNGLIDDPDIYMMPETPFIVAGITKSKNILSNTDYKTLGEDHVLSISLIRFVLSMFALRRKDIQFEYTNTKQLIDVESINVANGNLLKIDKSNLIAVSVSEFHGYIVIVNTDKKVFSYIATTITDPGCINEYLNQFQRFINIHNDNYPTNQIDVVGWRKVTYECPIPESDDHQNHGLYILKYVKDLLGRNKINNEVFDVCEFREYLSRYILNNSKAMKNLCLICGLKDYGTFENYDEDIDAVNLYESDSSIDDKETLYWVRCDICLRWSHRYCSHTTTLNKKHPYVCILCNGK